MRRTAARVLAKFVLTGPGYFAESKGGSPKENMALAERLRWAATEALLARRCTAGTRAGKAEAPGDGNSGTSNSSSRASESSRTAKPTARRRAERHLRLSSAQAR